MNTYSQVIKTLVLGVISLSGYLAGAASSSTTKLKAAVAAGTFSESSSSSSMPSLHSSGPSGLGELRLAGAVVSSIVAEHSVSNATQVGAKLEAESIASVPSKVVAKSGSSSHHIFASMPDLDVTPLTREAQAALGVFVQQMRIKHLNGYDDNDNDDNDNDDNYDDDNYDDDYRTGLSDNLDELKSVKTEGPLWDMILHIMTHEVADDTKNFAIYLLNNNLVTACGRLTTDNYCGYAACILQFIINCVWKSCDTDIFRLFLSKNKSLLNEKCMTEDYVRNNNMLTPLMYCIVEMRNEKVAGQNRKVWMQFHTQILKILVEHGAIIKGIVNDDGDDVIALAHKYKLEDIEKYLTHVATEREKASRANLLATLSTVETLATVAPLGVMNIMFDYAYDRCLMYMTPQTSQKTDQASA